MVVLHSLYAFHWLVGQESQYQMDEKPRQTPEGERISVVNKPIGKIKEW